MSTGTAVKTNIATLLNRSDLTNLIATMCDLAVKRNERECLWFQLTSTTVAVSSGVGYASFPSDFIKEVKDGFLDTDGAPLRKKSLAEIIHLQTYNSGSDEPTYYAVADKFYFYPTPDSAYNLNLRYYKSLGYPSDTSSNAWTVEAEDLTMYTTLEDIWRYLRNTEEQAKAKEVRNNILKDLKSLSGKLTGKGQVTYVDY